MITENPLLHGGSRSTAVLLLATPLIYAREGMHNISDKMMKMKPFEKDKGPAPLPATRKRRLSLPLAEPAKIGCPGFRNLQKTDPQESCLLVKKLPVEIRSLIWMEAMGRCKVMLVKGPRKLSSRLLSHEENGKDTTKLDLLITCRLIYSEAISFLYSHNDFVMDDMDCLHFLSRTTLPRRFNSIRNIHIDWHIGNVMDDDNSIASGHHLSLPDPVLRRWERVCSILPHMRGLRVLRLNLQADDYVDVSNDVVLKIFEPLRNLWGDIAIDIRWNVAPVVHLLSSNRTRWKNAAWNPVNEVWVPCEEI